MGLAKSSRGTPQTSHKPLIMLYLWCTWETGYAQKFR